MSMPTIPEEHHRPCKHEVVIDLLKSIAMEETALSHLINAEAKKIQAFIGENNDFPLCPSTEEILSFNSHVFKVMDIIVMKEWLLLRKMKDVIELSGWIGSADWEIDHEE